LNPLNEKVLEYEVCARRRFGSTRFVRGGGLGVQGLYEEKVWEYKVFARRKFGSIRFLRARGWGVQCLCEEKVWEYKVCENVLLPNLP
jgi:hypothetical protein